MVLLSKALLIWRSQKPLCQFLKFGEIYQQWLETQVIHVAEPIEPNLFGGVDTRLPYVCIHLRRKEEISRLSFFWFTYRHDLPMNWAGNERTELSIHRNGLVTKQHKRLEAPDGKSNRRESEECFRFLMIKSCSAWTKYKNIISCSNHYVIFCYFLTLTIIFPQIGINDILEIILESLYFSSLLYGSHVTSVYSTRMPYYRFAALPVPDESK